eukprot:TRINITY_DN2520_c0_g2_i2.p1 TRINITY_DN2520_c0_g2~~TRINITY_DN2520_c0_g2_i2.p1  ORF type:complete len:308 (-),score=45.42 TRINITY_DN2520_c0_g2_i2:391-1314(-)
MDNQQNFWQFGDDIRGQPKVSEDHKWLMVASKLAEQTRSKGERTNNPDLSKTPIESKQVEKIGIQEFNKFENFNFGLLNLDSKFTEAANKNSYQGGAYTMNNVYQKSNGNVGNINLTAVNSKYNNKYNNSNNTKDINSNINNNSNVSGNNNSGGMDKRFKTLPSTEMLPRDEVLGGYIFVCNNDTMQEDLKRQLFGLPPRYRDSVRAIKPGLPLFLYNYTTHQLHGIFEAASFGGSNIDPTAWEDKKCKGESRFPAQVRIVVRKLCKALEEDAFRPVLHHYDGPKFRLELSVPETLALLDLCEAGSM